MSMPRHRTGTHKWAFSNVFPRLRTVLVIEEKDKTTSAESFGKAFEDLKLTRLEVRENVK
jgi:hypothetical protein